MKTIIDYFDNITEKQAELNWYFPDTDKHYSVVELYGLSQKFASKFEALQLAPQSVVGFILPNTVELVAYLYACWYKNLVAVPLRPKSGKFHDYSDFINGCNDSCNFNLIICEDSTPEESLTSWRVNTSIDIKRSKEVSEISNTVSASRVEAKSHDIAIIQFSSGSTGFPKGVIVDHHMMITQLGHLEGPIRENQAGKPIKTNASWMPINHDLGMFSGVLMPVFVGSDNILATQEYYMRKPARWFQLLAELKVEVTFTTNAAISVALRSIKRLYGLDNINLSHLNLYITAEKISAVILRKSRDRLAPLGLSNNNIHSAYGMAENALGASISRTGQTHILRVFIDDSGKVKVVDELHPNSLELVSVGPPHINHTFTIQSDAGNTLPELYLGEINIQSDCLTPGYLNQPEITKEKLVNGFFKTGDLGFLHNGLLFFYGRKDDLIIYNGRNIVPEDIEETVESLDFVRHSASAVFSCENVQTGLMGLHLIIEGNISDSPALTYEKECIVREIIVDKHDVILTKVYFCGKSTIEKTSSGKKRRKVVKNRLLSGMLDVFASEDESIPA